MVLKVSKMTYLLLFIAVLAAAVLEAAPPKVLDVQLAQDVILERGIYQDMAIREGENKVYEGCRWKAVEPGDSFGGDLSGVYCLVKLYVPREVDYTRLMVVWFTPDGAVYETDRFSQLSGGHTWWLAARLDFDGGALCWPGEWVVEASVPGKTTRKKTFYLRFTNFSPTACFTYSPASPEQGEEVRFSADCSKDPDGEIVAFRWIFGDGAQAEGKNVSHTYALPASYTVILEVEDNCGNVARCEKPLTVSPTPPPNQPPIAQFTCPSQAVIGESVTFDASGSYDPDGTIISYFWQFGDGTTGHGVNVTHVYQTPKYYTVLLTVTDDRGAKATATRRLQVSLPSNQNPVAAFTWSPEEPNPGEEVSFDASSSYDPDGTIRTYLWDFNGDGRVDLTTAEPVVSHAYPACGDKRVSLRVVDDHGASSLAESVLHVNCPPRARFSWNPRVPEAAQEVRFDASVSSDEGTIVSYTWDFGDGSPIESGVQVTHSYGAPGRYTVELTVTDERGLVGTSQQTVRVNAPPVAAFKWAPEVANPGAVVTFQAVRGHELSYDPDGTIVSYTWDFGDGTPAVTVRSPTSQVTHSFATCGDYTVTLTVTDNDGATATVSQAIRVNCPPVAAFTWSPEEPNPGEEVSFDASSSYDPDGSITSCTWQFGDGSPPLTVTTLQLQVSHTYARSGVYRVHLTVRDDSGAQNTESAVVEIKDRIPPTSTASLPPLSCANGWYSEPVPVVVSATDNDEVASIKYRVDEGDISSVSGGRATVRISQEGVHEVEYWSVDKSGNEEVPHNVVTILIDRTPPVVTIRVPAPGEVFYLNEPITPEVQITDTVSGIAEEMAEQVVDTSSVGRHTFKVIATNHACLTTSVARNYYVRYKCMLELPIKQELDWMKPSPPERLRGQPVPVSYQLEAGTPLAVALILSDFNGTPVTSSVAPAVQVIAVTGTGPNEKYTVVQGLGGTLVYNTMASRYEITIPTFGLSRGVYELWLTTDDGGIHRFRFRVM